MQNVALGALCIFIRNTLVGKLDITKNREDMLHGGQPVGATVSCAHFQNCVDSRALYPWASSEGSRQRSSAN